MTDLARFTELTRAAASRRNRDPLTYFRPTPGQRAWLEDPAQVKLFRAGNQLGKTLAGCVEVLWRCLGRHRYYETQDPPIEVWIICHSMEMSVALQSKLQALIPPETLHPSTEFVPGKGFRGKTPLVRFKNGSMIRIKTTSQNSLGLASATIDYILIDEPPSREVWGELQLRIFRNRGSVGLTMTPIGRNVDWLKDLVEDGKVSDHCYTLSEENTRPEGALFPLVTQQEIDKLSEILLPFERAQRLEGAWEGTPEGRIFECYDTTKMYGDHLPRGSFKYGVGIDHGGGAGQQVAVLVAVAKEDLGKGKVWIIDESAATDPTAPEDDARAILGMLRRNGLRLEDIELWRGDRPYPGRRGVGTKSNSLLEKWIIKLAHARSRQKQRLRIMHPRKFAGSVEYGSRILHSTMVRGEFWCRPEAHQVDHSLRMWTGADDEHKHAIGAVRYIVVDLLGKRFAGVKKVRIF